MGNEYSHYQWPLLAAAQAGDLISVQLLLQQNPSLINLATPVHGKTALHVAAECGHVHVIQKLVESGAAINSLDSRGRTPLHYAVAKGHTSAIQKLIESSISFSSDSIPH